jgi:hypothetical protein
MRLKLLLPAVFLASLCITAPASAAFDVIFGATWDDPGLTLQAIVDAEYGPGVIDVENDYIGKLAADVDPWFWLDQGFSALIVREVAGNADRNLVGWYKETGTMPVIDDVDDGVLFIGSNGPGYSRTVQLNGVQKFGFYMNPNGPYSSANAPDGELFFTNRTYNDLGPDGSGAVHVPFDADVQALIFDVSAITGTPNQWLVCWEDLDSGAPIQPCCEGVDNDFNDFVMEVTAVGATPVQAVTFGGVKARYVK